jgi:uncharacterized protein YndB with AHSA1/START domain
MSDILHEIHIDAPKQKVYAALASRDGLSHWWTSTTTGESEPGKTLQFRFGEHVTEMRVEKLAPDEGVSWECTRSMPDWLGTRVTFELTEDAGRTTLRFGHRGWRQTDTFFAHCSMKWATFLLSLREYAETGAGKPFPRDLKI